MFNSTVNRYNAVSAHDGTGLGNVVHDMVDERTHKIVMVGRDRTNLLVEYITAVEQGVYDPLPRNTPAYDSHKATTVDEVYAPGRWNSHLADDVAAFAIMHNAAERQPPPASGVVVPRSEYSTKMGRVLNPQQGTIIMGEVSTREDDYNPYIVT